VTEIQRAAALRLEEKKKALEHVRARAEAAVAKAVAEVERAERVCSSCENESVAEALADVLHDDVVRVRKIAAEEARLAADLADAHRAGDVVEIEKLDPVARAAAAAAWKADADNAAWLEKRLAEREFRKLHEKTFGGPPR